MLSLALALVVSQPYVRALQGRAPDGGSSWNVAGNVNSTPSAYFGTLFGHSRAAHPFTLGDVINNYGIDTDTWGVDAGGGRIVGLPLEAAILLEADGGLMTEIQTHRNYRYQAGRQQTILQTAIFTSPLDAGVVRFGEYCVHDGLYWQRGSRLDVGLEACRRSSAHYKDGGIYDECFAVDAGASFAFNKGNIYEIRYAWLGVHQVDWYVNGLQVRSENFDGRLSEVYMSTAHLPIRAEVSGNASLKYICSNVTSEGGQNPPEPGFSYTRQAVKTISAASGVLPVLALRVAGTLGGAHSHIEVIPESISCQANPASKTRIYAFLNPTTLTGASWSQPSGTAIEVDVSATAFAGGQQVCTFGGEEGTHELRHVFGISKRSLRTRWAEQKFDTLLIAADSLSGNVDVTCSIEWGEIR